jgi:hypothetical protein
MHNAVQWIAGVVADPREQDANQNRDPENDGEDLDEEG